MAHSRPTRRPHRSRGCRRSVYDRDPGDEQRRQCRYLHEAGTARPGRTHDHVLHHRAHQWQLLRRGQGGHADFQRKRRRQRRSTTAVLDGVTTLSSGAAFNTETLAAGAHTIVITSRDRLANASTTTITITVHATIAGLTMAVND